MSKKIFCLALAMMLLACSTAFAAIPSKTANDIVSDAPVAAEGVAFAPDFTITSTEDLTGTAQEILDRIAAFLVLNEEAVIKAFGEETEEAVAALLPEDVLAEELVLAEFFPVLIANYDPAYGDVTVAFSTLTAEHTAVAILGAVADAEEPVESEAAEALLENTEATDIIWLLLKTAIEDGKVVVTFTAEAIESIPEGAETVLTFLNTPAE